MKVKTAAERVSAARIHMVPDLPWFGALGLRLEVKEDPSIDTMCTNGTEIRYSPAFVDSISEPELWGVLAHEICHCAYRHMYRMQTRDPELWNIATDLVINQHIVETSEMIRARSGGVDRLLLPAGALLDPQYKDMSAEQVYAKLYDDQTQGKPTPAPGTGSTGSFEAPAAPEPGTGEPGTEPGATAGDVGMSEQAWEIAAEQAGMIADKAGSLAGSVARTLADMRGEVADWRSILRQFIDHTIPVDYTYSTPNRRLYAATGLYLPGVKRENTPPLVVAVDTSGSVSADQLNRFANEIRAVVSEMRPELLTVIYCDSKIQAVQTFGPDDQIELDPRGGGGTRFAPVFDYVEAENINTAAIIYITDLDGPIPEAPAAPVLWVTPLWVNRTAPYGEVVRLNS